MIGGNTLEIRLPGDDTAIRCFAAAFAGRIAYTAAMKPRLFAALALFGIGATMFALMLRPGHPEWKLLTPAITGGFIGGGLGVLHKEFLALWAVVGAVLGTIGGMILLRYGLSR
jgi:hypothetical protein